MVFRGAHGLSAHQFHTKRCRLIVATFVSAKVVDARSIEVIRDMFPALLRRPVGTWRCVFAIVDRCRSSVGGSKNGPAPRGNGL